MLTEYGVNYFPATTDPAEQSLLSYTKYHYKALFVRENKTFTLHVWCKNEKDFLRLLSCWNNQGNLWVYYPILEPRK